MSQWLPAGEDPRLATISAGPMDTTLSSTSARNTRAPATNGPPLMLSWFVAVCSTVLVTKSDCAVAGVAGNKLAKVVMARAHTNR